MYNSSSGYKNPLDIQEHTGHTRTHWTYVCDIISDHKIPERSALISDKRKSAIFSGHRIQKDQLFRQSLGQTKVLKASWSE